MAKNKNSRVMSVSKEQCTAYLYIIIGCFVGGLAYPMFLVPNSIAPGGLTGIATILNHLLGLPVGLVSMLMNLPLFLVGYKAMGKVFVWRSFVATLLFSIFIDILPIPSVTDDILLGSIFGGLLLGIGLGLILRGEATTGGSDMIARMVHRRFPIVTVGVFLFALDFLVIIAAGFFIGAHHALYAIISIYVSSRAVDIVLQGLNTAKACYIMTSHSDEITSRLMTELERGVTLLSATGAYSGKPRPVILCVVSRQEVPRVKQIVNHEDPVAFMFVSDTYEVLGEGFSNLSSNL